MNALFTLTCSLFALSILVPLITRAAKHDLDYFQPTTFLGICFLFFYVLKPVDFHLFGGNLITPERSITEVLGILYAYVGYLFFGFGYHIQVGKSISGVLPVISKKDAHEHVFLVYLVLTGLGVVGLVLLTYEKGLASYVSHLASRKFYFSGHGVAYYLLFFFPGSFFVYTAYSIRNGRIVRSRLLVLAFVISFVGALCTGSRLTILSIILGTLIILHYMDKRIPLKVILVAGIVMLLLLVSFRYMRKPGGDFMAKITTGISKHAVSENVIVETFHIIATNFLPYEELLVMIEHMPTKLDYQYGRIYLSGIIRIMPSWLIGPKRRFAEFSPGRIYTSSFFPEREFRGKVTLFPGIIGEGYVNLHVGGIIMTMLFLGVLYRSLYEYLKKDVSNRDRVLIYAISILALSRTIKGGINSGLPYFLGYLIPILFGTLLLKLHGNSDHE